MGLLPFRKSHKPPISIGKALVKVTALVTPFLSADNAPAENWVDDPFLKAPKLKIETPVLPALPMAKSTYVLSGEEAPLLHQLVSVGSLGKDGHIHAQEAEGLLEKLTAKYGKGAADSIMKETLAGFLPYLDAHGVDWYLKLTGHEGADAQYFDQVAGSHVNGAKWIDVDGDKKVSTKDLLAVLSDSIVARVVPVSAALADSMAVEKAAVQAAYDLADAKVRFGIVTKQTYPKSMWKKVGYATFAPKAGKTPAEALRFLLANGREHRHECGTDAVVHGYLTLLYLKGDAWFNEHCADMKVGPWKASDSFWKYIDTRSSPGKKPMTEARKDKLRAGQGSYFKNWDVSFGGWRRGWQGENVIYLGRNDRGEALFYGHPFGVTTGEHIVRSLAEWKKRGGRTPGLLDQHRIVDPHLAR